METESLGKLLPRILFPYAQQWAEGSGLTVLSRLLVDEQFLALVEKYCDELVPRMAQATPAYGNGNGRSNGTKATSHEYLHVSDTDTNAADVASLNARVQAMEAQQQMHEALLEILRSKARPLALALGCCPECLVGVGGCPKCWGRGSVAHYPPDYKLLDAQVVSPLAARGVPLVLNVSSVSGEGR